MVWVGSIGGIIMASGISKLRPGAVFPFVNVEGKKTGFRGVGESGHLGHDQNTFAALIEPDFPRQGWCMVAALNMGHCVGTGRAMLHKITSFPAYVPGKRGVHLSG